MPTLPPAHRSGLRRPGAIAAAALVLMTTSCGLFRGDADTQSSPLEEATPADAPTEVPDTFLREVRLFSSGADSHTGDLEIEAVESTADSTALYFSITNTAETLTSGASDTTTPFLFDPVEGTAYLPLLDGDPEAPGTRGYGSHDDGEHIPFFPGVTHDWRWYFPPLPDDVEYVTFFGFGAGAMTGIPVERVAEHRPTPEAGIEGDEGAGRDPEAGETLVWPIREPDDDAQSFTLGTEGYVEGADSSITRDGDEETIALSADVLFGFDEAELSEGSAELIADTAESIETYAPDSGTIAVTGHTDGVGDDAYNDELSEERAEAVAEELEPLLSGGLALEVAGRGSAEPVAEEGGPDDEEARRLNRRVELGYTAVVPVPGQSDPGEGIAAAERHVGAPASYRADPGEPVATVEHDGFELAAFPLLRDGANVVAEVELTNTTGTAAQPDIGEEDMRIAARGESLGGFRLHEAESGLTRYPLILRFDDTDERAPFAEVAREFGPEETYRLAVLFPAPDPDTSEVVLEAGPFGEIEVPIA